jgi:glycosyltransferase involved in cell wall biosynthesis
VPRLVIAGGDGADAAAARARAAEPDLAAHVEFAGYVEPDTRVDLYRRAVALVMPSWLEGFGLPALEAMTIGVPVVASARGALPEVLGGAGALCDTSDPADFAATLARVLDQPARRDAMRDAGWRRAQDFSWAHTAERTRDAWRQAAAARQARA